MKRLVLTVLAASLPLSVAAQTSVNSSTSEGILIAPAAARTAAGSAAVQAPAPAPVRRRPSMVGYIGDSTIESRMRVRFDSLQEITAADRAEFFYAKCGCYRGLLSTDPAYDPDAPGPGPGVLTEANAQQLHIYSEYALNAQFSIVGDLPFRFLKPQSFAPGTGSFGDASGVSDLRAGVKIGFSNPTNQFTVQVLAGMPTGDASKGLGSDRWSIEPTLLYSGQMGNRAGLEAQFGAVFPTDGSAGVPTSGPDKFYSNVLYWGIGPSFDVYQNGDTAFGPVVEFVGWHVVDGFSTAEGAIDGLNIVNLKIGGRVVFGNGNSIYVGYGKALTDATWYDDVVRFEYRLGL